MQYAELELKLSAHAVNDIRASLLLRSDRTSESDLVIDQPVQFDYVALRELLPVPLEYGQLLSKQLFAAPGLREAWAKVEGYRQGANTLVRLRLLLDPTAEELHRLRWEVLADPFSQQLLCQSERIVFSRYLASSDMGRLALQPLQTARALLLISNPSDLEVYNLKPLDVAAELAQTRQALAGIPLSVLGDQPSRPATLNQLIEQLRQGHTLLYVVCHGTLLRGEPLLWLMNDDGTSARVSGASLVQRIADLPAAQRPRLIVLASCESAGRDESGAVLAALAPQLVRAGVAAVIGMQGLAPVSLINQLMPRLFNLLQSDGVIDRALAIARSELPPTSEWWLPVLYLRVADGMLWQTAAPSSPPNAVSEIAAGLDALLVLLRSPSIHALVTSFRSHFSAARSQVSDLIALKDIHDLLHTLQFQCYLPLTREARGFPNDELALESMRDYGLTLHTRHAELGRMVAGLPNLLGTPTWIDQLDEAYSLLNQALDQLDPVALKRALWLLHRVLAVQPSYLNANLITLARALRLQRLVDAMESLHAQLAQLSGDHGRVQRFTQGVAALVAVHEQLNALISEHDAWQAIDRELRRISESLRHDQSELEFSWPDLTLRLQSLALGTAAWAVALRHEMAQLQQALAGQSSQRPAAVFQRCNRLIGERFFQVDVDLKRLCGQLRELGDPLHELERVLT